MGQLMNNRSMSMIRGLALLAVTALLSSCSTAPTAPIVSGINDTGIKAGSVADSLSTTWSQVATQPDGRSKAAVGILTSAKEFGKIVDADYATYLHRSADAKGRQSWLNSLLSGQRSPAQVAQGLLASDEYFALAGAGGG